jgi:hypothetical protein
MSPFESKSKSAPRRHRFLLHLFGTRQGGGSECRYTATIRLWAARGSSRLAIHERAFSDEDDLIRTVNPLLENGSDVRDVLSHIESPDGFFYLLHLTAEEACKFGWRR